MKNPSFNTLKFFRHYFEIPARFPLQWGVVRETSPQGDELRLAVLLKGTDRYIDVAMRRFFQTIDTPIIKRQTAPAQRTSLPDAYQYLAETGWRVVKPKSFIRDIYFTALFSEDLIATRLL